MASNASKRPRVVLVSRCFVKAGSGRFLIIKRAPTDANNAGKWEVPGGKLDEGQDLTHALEREVLEETGLLVEPIHRLAWTDSFVIGKGKYKGLTYIVLFSIARVIGGKVAMSHEHTEYKWVGYNELIGRDLTHETKSAAIYLMPRLTRRLP